MSQLRQDEQELNRGLGGFDATMLVIGIVIGSGIFLTTGTIARDLPSPLLILLAWLLGGVLSLAGALTFAELGAAWPQSGGLYVYLREAYGPLAAFLFGWLTFLVYQTGAAAAVAVGFAEYLGYFLPLLGTDRPLWQLTIGPATWSVSVGQVAACVALLSLTATNVHGVRTATLVQNGLSAVKLLAVGAFAVVGVWLGREGDVIGAPWAAPPSGSWITALGVALVAVLWTFDGWHNITFAAAEIRQPERNIPRALIAGTLIVTAVYLLTNLAYLKALPVDRLSGEVRVAEKAAAALFGPVATGLISGAVLVSTLGATNGVLLTGARVYFAMARDGLFLSAAARVHRRYRTPSVALWAQGAWACLLALSGRFEQLFTYSTFAVMLIYLAAGASVFMLRRKRPDAVRPYRVPGYPWVPGVFLVATGLLLVNTVLTRPVESLAGLGFLVAGVLVYMWLRRSSARANRSLRGSGATEAIPCADQGIATPPTAARDDTGPAVPSAAGENPRLIRPEGNE